MRINNIDNKINFGYNKELNDKVNKKLKNAKGNKEMAQHLLELNNICNKTEDLLRKAEKEKNHRALEMYSYLFVNMKPSITEELNDRFPLLNYRKTELETYNAEKKARNLGEEYHWLDQITDELSDYAEMDGEFSDDELEGNSTESTASTKTAPPPDLKSR